MNWRRLIQPAHFTPCCVESSDNHYDSVNEKATWVVVVEDEISKDEQREARHGPPPNPSRKLPKRDC